MTSVKHCPHCLRGYTGDQCPCVHGPIKCYAKVTSLCMDGYLLPDDWEESWRDDGTYDEVLDGIVCDACYAEVCRQSPSGAGLHKEIKPTLARIRATLPDPQDCPMCNGCACCCDCDYGTQEAA